MEVASRDELEDAAEHDDDHQPHISLHAIVGVCTRDTMQVRVQLGQISVIALLDSGSTHNFVSESAARHTGLCFIPRMDLAVTVANDDRVRCPGVFRDAEPFRRLLRAATRRTRHGAGN